jgi:transposase
MPSVSNFNKIKIVTLAQRGMSQAQISMDLRIPKSTISCILKKWRQSGTTERRQGSGRPSTSTAEQDNMLLNRLRNSPFMRAVEAVNTSGFPGSFRTARRRVRGSELKNHVAARKLSLTPMHREARMAFCLEHLARDDAFWAQVIFSDEKVFQSCPNGRLRVYRPRNSRYDEPYVQTTERSGRFSANIWAWISVDSPGVMLHVEDRLNSDVYVRILEDVMLPSVSRIFPNFNFTFQQDNCSVHTAHRVTEWFRNNNINVLDWPSRSPDLNPIENMWGLLVRNLQQRRQVFRNRAELLTAITNAWQSLPRDYHRDLCLSMSRRVRRVIDANGAMTKY